MTYAKARIEKMDAWNARHGAELERQTAERKAAEMMAAHPEIGKLMRKGKPVYYVDKVGEAYREASDPAELV